MLELKGVSKNYRVGSALQKVLKKLTINFRESEFAAILGPSGSGKTTLLNIIGGLDHYDAGDLKINEVSTKQYKDKDWDAYRNHRIGFVFQSYNLIPHQTVLTNVKLALTLSGVPKREATMRARRVLAEVGLKEHINKRPAQLSGGQMQRVAIARALVNDPDILLADEPTGALDSETSVAIMNLLAEIAKKKLVIMVTHNPELADEYATRIITLKDGEITSDSNPYDGKNKTDLDLEARARKQRKTRMSFLTAFLLSLKNLLTKKGRTALVAVAGSIGIIGIALIMAVSAGFQAYIDSIERDTLTSYPLALMKESTNITGILLNFASTSDGGDASDGKVRENQVLTASLGNVTQNDLGSFMNYYNGHQTEMSGDVRLVEYEYNIDPMIYTVDATGELAKLNPSGLFSSILGSSSLMNSYSSLTSVFTQYARENIENDTDILAGRYPESYDEMVVLLPNKGEISEFLTYSLGFHDTDELNEIITSIMGGEAVEIKNEPLELTYDDLMNVNLRLVYPADIYKYNEKYNVYEDMSNDANFMQNVYDNKSERLKIVGVVTPKSSFLSRGGGVLYLPSLVTHIIAKSKDTAIVQKQINNPTVDIFSNTKFGERKNNFNFGFSDFVSVDQAKLASAIKVDLDQDAVSAKTAEYMQEIAQEITVDTTPAYDALADEYDTLTTALAASVVSTVKLSEVDTMVDELMEKQDLSLVVGQFVEMTADTSAVYGEILTQVNNMYSGLMKTLLKAYIGAYYLQMSIDSSTDPGAVMVPLIYNPIAEGIKSSEGVELALNKLAAALTQIHVQQEVVRKVGGLAQYLSNSFAEAFHIDTEALLGAFTLNFTEDELARVVSAMFNESDATYNTNLALLGYQNLDDPKEIAFYFASFDGKTRFMEFVDHYNDLMREYAQDDKVIEYSDTTGLLMNSVKVIVDAVSYVLIAFVSISLIVSSIMIGVITYISVYERTKEIGILRAIGASKRNISNIFNAETFIVGLLAGIFGITISYLLIPIINAVIHQLIGDIPLDAQLAPLSALGLIMLSVVLTLIGGLIPAKAASKRDPVEALRSE